MKLTRQSLKRREDDRFIRGKGEYTGDLQRPGMLYAVMVRSAYAHASILRINVSEALKADGVVAIYMHSDLNAAGILPIPGGIRHSRPDGSEAPRTDRPSLADGRVRHVGEAVAMVVAESRALAVDAAELVSVDYDGLPAVITTTAARSGPAVWNAVPDNIGFVWRGGDAEATNAALASASHITRLESSVSRISANPLEPRIFMAEIGEGGQLVLHGSHQSPFRLRDQLATLGFSDDRLQVMVGDVGGSFGMKGTVQPEAIAVCFAARTLQRPVLWESDRSEAFLSDEHGRESDSLVEIGFDDRHRIVALRAKIDLNIGAYLSNISGSAVNNIGTMAGMYDISAISAEMTGIFTNTTPITAYRGAGRPEATYLIERILDVAARELGISPFELRRRNLIPANALPYRTALTFTYDSGDFAEVMRSASTLADFPGFDARRDEADRRGMVLGLGICNCIEASGGPAFRPPKDIARLSLLHDGRLLVESGSFSVGQGYETAFPQLVADRFGIAVDQVAFRQGDTDRLPGGRGNGGSGSLCVGGPAIADASEKLADALLAHAARLLGAHVDAVSYADGVFRRRDTNRSLSLAELAAALPKDAGGAVCDVTGEFAPERVTFPNGTHIAEVEVDPDTGFARLVRYAAVEDIGHVLNPMLVEGQIHGGIVQGAGQALGELIVYAEDGQLMTGSFMDYPMPRASDFPNFLLGHVEVPTDANPLGVKGVGEAGTVGALAATMNAVNDALAQFGIRHLDMPATPARIWHAIDASRRK